MTTLKASETRIPPKVFNNVAIRNMRASIERRDGERVVLISQKQYDLFEALEDYLDNMEADEALAEMKAAGKEPVSLDQVKARLGL